MIQITKVNQIILYGHKSNSKIRKKQQYTKHELMRSNNKMHKTSFYINVWHSKQVTTHYEESERQNVNVDVLNQALGQLF